MAAQFEKHFVQDLTQDIKIRQCGTIVFNADNESNIISVDLYNGAEEYSGGGTVTGACICPDGSTVPLTGSINGKTASVTLTGDCFAFPGQIGIGVQVTSGTVKTTVLKAIYNVELFETDTVIDPGSRITMSVADLIQDINDAMADIPASDTNLKAAMAPVFSTSTAYQAGDYVWYEGQLYKFTAGHAAGTWTGTDAGLAALGNDVADLKSAFTILDDFYTDTTAIDLSTNQYSVAILRTNNKWKTTTSGSPKKCVIKPIQENAKKVLITANADYNAEIAFLKTSDHTNSTSPNYTDGSIAPTVIASGSSQSFLIPDDAAYLYILLTYNDETSTPSATEFGFYKEVAEKLTPRNITGIIEQGAISATSGNGGNNVDGTTSCRTNVNLSVPTGGIEISQTGTTYLFSAYGYSSEEISHENFVGLLAYRLTNIKINQTDAPYVRFAIHYSDISDITPEDCDGVTITRYAQTDNTLSISDEPADAKTVGIEINKVKSRADHLENTANDYTMLVAAQTRVAEDWHFPLINVWRGMGLASNHIIPGTNTIWSESGTTALDQRHIWMSDGSHPFKGVGLTEMYANMISGQLALVSPSYRSQTGELDTTKPDWANRTLLWLGTSIPAGNDPDAGSGTGATYPQLVAQKLNATVVNKARGKSCLRINASTGQYTNIAFNHFVRAVTRTVAECDEIASDWENIYPLLESAPETLSSENLNIMKTLSYENLILPYLDGTNPAPDLWVIDYGHNDVRPLDIYGKQDTYMEPTVDNIRSGLLAEDTYMTANNYANLATAMGSLSGISDLAGFAASVNRNCFKGAMNFLITMILRYDPYARIAIVTDYD